MKARRWRDGKCGERGTKWIVVEFVLDNRCVNMLLGDVGDVNVLGLGADGDLKPRLCRG